MKQKWQTFTWAFATVWKLNRKMLIICFVLNGVLSVLPALIIHYTQRVISIISDITENQTGNFQNIVGIIFILGILMTISALSNRMNGDFLYMVMYDSYYLGMQEILMEKVQKIPYQTLKEQNNHEEYVAVTNRAGSLTDLISSICILFREFLTVGSLLVVIACNSIWSFWIILSYIVFSVWRSGKVLDQQRVNMMNVRKNESIAEYYQRLPMNLGVAKEIRIYETYEEILKQWGIAYKGIERQERKYVWGKEKRSFFHGFGLYIFMFLFCVIQIGQLFQGQTQIDIFLSILLLFQNLGNAIHNITSGIISMDYGLFALQRQKDFLEKMEEYESPECDPEKRTDDETVVEMRNMSFSYGNTQVLENINLKIRRGEIVALLGENGSGKSTLTKLIIGQLTPSSGEILFHGRPYQKCDMRSIKNNIGIYFQDFFLFHMNMKENIEIGSIRERTEANMERAVQLGGLHGILAKTPDGLDTMLKKDIDKNGLILSGGEQQRVGISRVFYGNKELLIFDEPASALDPIAEVRQFESIRASAESSTLILISHRIGFARLADRIIVIKNGKMEEDGKHQELLDRRGAYYELFTQQAKWYQE